MYDPIVELARLPIAPPTIKLNSEGRTVRLLCRALGWHGFNDLWRNLAQPVPSTFNAAVRALLLRFQQSRGLRDDGICGPLTWAALANIGSMYPLPVQPVAIASSDQHLVDQLTRVVLVAQREIGIREEGGKNRGPRVDQYILKAEGTLGEPWCCDFCEFVYEWALDPIKPVFDIGRSVPDLVRRAELKLRVIPAKAALPGDLLGLRNKKGHPFHVGIIEIPLSAQGKFGTIEGNTNAKGSSEGNAVERKTRAAAGNVCIRAA